MADLHKLRDKITSTIYPNGKGAINAADHQSLLLDMADIMGETDTKLTELSGEKANKNAGINLFNPQTASIGQFVNNAGVIGNSSGYNASSYIEVTENTQYYCAKNSLKGFRFVCLYDANKNVISSSIADVTTFITPSGCKYVRVSVYADEMDVAQLSAYNTYYASYNPIEGYIRSEKEQLEIITSDLQYTQVSPIKSSYINTSAAVGATMNLTPTKTSGWSHYVLDVLPSDKIQLTGTGGGSQSLWTLLDAENRILSKATYFDAQNIVITIPEGCSRVVVNSKDSTQHYLAHALGESILSQCASNSENMSALLDGMQIVKSVFDKGNADVVIGKCLADSNGLPQTTGSYITTGFMPIVANERYFIAPQKAQIRIVCFYDNNKTYIPNKALQFIDYFDAPIDATFARVSFEDNLGIDNVSINNVGKTFYPFGSFVKFKSEEQVSILDVIGVRQEYQNLANPNDPEIREEYYYAGGWGANAALDTTGFIEVEVGHTYALFPKIALTNANDRNMRFVSFFDKDKNYIENVGEIKEVTITNENCKYIKISFYNRESTNVERKRTLADVAVGDVTIISSFVEYSAESVAFLKSKVGRDSDSIVTKEYVEKAGGALWGKKWVACGDSYTEGDFTSLSNTEEYQFTSGVYEGKNKVYPYFIGLRNNMEIVNEAKCGSTITYINGTINEFSAANGRYTKIPQDADYITLYFGINDDNRKVTIGNINDTSNTTFYGAWNIVLTHLLTNHPNAKIGIIITNNTANTELIEAEKAIAKKYGIGILNFADDESISYIYRQFKRSTPADIRSIYDDRYKVSSSNTHPNAAMHERESYIIESWLRSL